MPYTVNVDSGDLEYNESAAALGAITDITCDVGSVSPVAGVVVLAGGPGINTSGVGNTATVSFDAPSVDINTLGGSPLAVSNGGTGQVTLPDGAVLIGNGTNPVQSVTMVDGEVLIGVTGGDPVPAQLTAGAGIAINSVAGAITITSTAGGFTWVRVAGIAQAIAPQTGYVATNGALTTFTLPALAPLGSTFIVAGEGAGLWTIAQNAGQQIHCGVVSTTAGVAGSLSSTHRRDVVELVCTNTDTTWTAVDFVGNLGAL